jgi:hypothetical protein
MEFKGTKGKWFFKFSSPADESKKHDGFNTGGLCIVLVKTDKKIFNTPINDTICDLLHWRDNSKNEEIKANALLISKAPEMLELLIEFEYMCDKLKFPTEEELRELGGKARKLIKEATEF